MSNHRLVVILLIALLVCIGGAGYSLVTGGRLASIGFAMWFFPIVFLASLLLAIGLGLRKSRDE